jgi:hypothetical protein
LDIGVQSPTRANDPFGSIAVWCSMQRAGPLASLGQSASFRHSVLQNGLLGASDDATQSESSAQRLPSAGVSEQADPNGNAPAIGARQTSWKASPVATAGPITHTRPPLQTASALDEATWFEGREATDTSCPQKLMGHGPPPIASAGQ